MGTLTSIDVCSAALVKIGSNPIQSFSDNSKEAQTAGALYPRIKASMLAGYPWNFARYQIELNQLLTPPINPLWKYAFQAPADMLNMVVCNDASGRTTKYYCNNDQVWSNSDRVFADYIRALDESEWPEFYTDVVIARCAFEFAVPVTGIAADVERAIREYEWKEKRARNIDANQNPIQYLITPQNSSVIRARFGYTGA